MRRIAVGFIPALLKDRRGVTALEYAALAVGLVLTVITAAAVLGREEYTLMLRTVSGAL